MTDIRTRKGASRCKPGRGENKGEDDERVAGEGERMCARLFVESLESGKDRSKNSRGTGRRQQSAG